MGVLRPPSGKPQPPRPTNYAITEGIPGQGFNDMSGQHLLTELHSGMTATAQSPSSNSRGLQRSQPQYGWQESKYLGVPKIPLDPHNPYRSHMQTGTTTRSSIWQSHLAQLMVGQPIQWPNSIRPLCSQDGDEATIGTIGTCTPTGIPGCEAKATRSRRSAYCADQWQLVYPISSKYTNFISGTERCRLWAAWTTKQYPCNLIYNSSGGTDTTIGGVDMAQTNMSHQVMELHLLQWEMSTTLLETLAKGPITGCLT